MTILTANAEITPFINQVIGYVRVNKEYVHHNNSYECAAWWEDTKIQAGVYPLILAEYHLAPKFLYLKSKFSAVVVDDYFPALWGGVAVSNTPYKSNNIGCKREISHKFEIEDAIDKTGNSPGNDFDLFINPMMWQMFVRLAEDNLVKAQNSFNYFWNEYTNNPEDKYTSRVGMVAHCSNEMMNIARSIQKMKRCVTSLEDTYYNNLRNDNTSWVIQQVA